MGLVGYNSVSGEKAPELNVLEPRVQTRADFLSAHTTQKLRTTRSDPLIMSIFRVKKEKA